ncbi:uncharacterized protein N7484_005122 [Penicillium longicatenatum]|uniref:uncharacterized protein n=1 Tax=Penicillium longicatenatum TaxID=1561947 RepID=UPI002548AC80|nr:uncharacterized protein N7484_005122 [Penicillium longicatenatum]KAJ5651399.1 hypothetical protein N7484_005122 [Penicillium longicatenatum]
MASTTRPHDYYGILQVPPDADLTAIKLSWRRLARIKHPDKNPAKNATAEFQLLEEAYSTLSNPETRQIYDAKYRAYTSTSSARHSTRQTNSGEKQDKYKPTSSMTELLEQTKMWKSRLGDQEQLLRDVHARLRKLESEIAILHTEIATTEQGKAARQTIWGYLGTFLPGGSERQERQKEEQDRLYRDKIVTMRIKETEKARRLEAIRTHEANISLLRQWFFSTEYDIRRMTREKDLRDQEERAKMEEQMKREGWSYAHWSQTESRAHSVPKSINCKHRAWWNRIEVSWV